MLKPWLVVLSILLLVACDSTPPSAGDGAGAGKPPSLMVYKDPNCGCCGDWMLHLQQGGMQVQSVDVEDMAAIKQQYGVGPRYRSCHTAVDADSGYVFEGHIPATVMTRFLAEKPAGAIGLAVPGMPVGSPGMEMGERFEPYDVLLIKADGSSRVYVHIGTAAAQFANQ